jgi:hypothetical protein
MSWRSIAVSIEGSAISRASPIRLSSLRCPGERSGYSMSANSSHQMPGGGLLKLLEEPPPHLCIILCTTSDLSDKKIQETIISRCEVYPFLKIKTEDMRSKLQRIAAAEGLEWSEGWFTWVSQFAEGNMRIAESEIGKQLCVR